MADSLSSPSDAIPYLESLINKTLRLHTSDGRVFVGQMKCTDNERNIILAMTQEYRQPSQDDVTSATSVAQLRKGGTAADALWDMKKRFVGLVVVPGQYIEKIEVEG